jgi:hypothetical protein
VLGSHQQQIGRRTLNEAVHIWSGCCVIDVVCSLAISRQCLNKAHVSVLCCIVRLKEWAFPDFV